MGLEPIRRSRQWAAVLQREDNVFHCSTPSCAARLRCPAANLHPVHRAPLWTFPRKGHACPSRAPPGRSTGVFLEPFLLCVGPHLWQTRTVCGSPPLTDHWNCYHSQWPGSSTDHWSQGSWSLSLSLSFSYYLSILHLLPLLSNPSTAIHPFSQQSQSC